MGCHPVETRHDTPQQNPPSAEEAAIDSLRADSIYKAANVHYKSAMSYWSKDSTVASCKEFYRALEILEKRYPINQLPEFEKLIKPDRQMINLLSSTYRGMGTLYSFSLIPEATSCFYRNDFLIKKRYAESPKAFGSTMFLIGYAFDVSDRMDSACYYYDSAMRCFDYDSTDLDFRLSASRRSFMEYKLNHDMEAVIHAQKALLPHCVESDHHDVEMLIGYIYKEEKQYDSALVYLNRAYEEFERSESANSVAKSQLLEYMHEIYKALGDTEKMNECANLLVKFPHAQEVFAPMTAELTELFNSYIQKNHETDTLLEKQQMRRKNLLTGVVVVLALLALGLGIWLTHRRHKQTETTLREEHQQQREAFDQQREVFDQQREAFSQQLNEAQTALKEKTFDDLLEKVKGLYGKNPAKAREPILEAFNKAYPDVYEKLKSAYPDLTEQDCDLLVLNFLGFRIKEEAEILGLSQNTVMKYRSRLNQKSGKSPVADMLG